MKYTPHITKKIIFDSKMSQKKNHFPDGPKVTDINSNLTITRWFERSIRRTLR